MTTPWFIREGLHVKVGPTLPDGTPHPHAGKAGIITKSIDIYSDPYWLGPPSAMVKLDPEIRPQGFIWISLVCLDVSLEDGPETRPAYTSAGKDRANALDARIAN